MSEVDNTPTTFIATREFTGVDSSGREFSIKLGIGAPYRIDNGDWACSLSLEGLHSLRKNGIIGGRVISGSNAGSAISQTTY